MYGIGRVKIKTNPFTVYVMQNLAMAMLAVNSPPGTCRPFYCSAVGKAYLGTLPEDELDACLMNQTFSKLTPATITSKEKLKEALRLGRSKGYYVDDGEMNPQVLCVAAPIINRIGRPNASIGVSGPRREKALEDLSALGALIAGEANVISLSLGCAPEPVMPAAEEKKRKNRGKCQG